MMECDVDPMVLRRIQSFIDELKVSSEMEVLFNVFHESNDYYFFEVLTKMSDGAIDARFGGPQFMVHKRNLSISKVGKKDA